MSAYTGFLIRRERLRQNLSQEGLARGVCAVSYLSKIEQGLVEPGVEIIDRLFAALHIDFVRDPALEAEAQRQLERYFYLRDADESTDAPAAFFAEYGDRLACSEFALPCQVVRLHELAETACDKPATRALLAEIEPFAPVLSAFLRQKLLLLAARFTEDREAEGAYLEQAVAFRRDALALYRQANWAFRMGRNALCVELAEEAYALAGSEGNPSVMIHSSFILGSCACNQLDMEQAKRYYRRALALCRGYRIDLADYAHYNLGSTYLELGDDAQALHDLMLAGERTDDVHHNLMLHQKLAILFSRTGRREEGLAHLAKAQALLCEDEVSKSRRPDLLACMVRFAALLYEPDPLSLPEFEQVTRTLYEDAGAFYGHGFRQFYGRYLVTLYAEQRRYKEALAVREQMDRHSCS